MCLHKEDVLGLKPPIVKAYVGRHLEPFVEGGARSEGRRRGSQAHHAMQGTVCTPWENMGRCEVIGHNRDNKPDTGQVGEAGQSGVHLRQASYLTPMIVYIFFHWRVLTLLRHAPLPCFAAFLTSTS